MKDLIGVIVCNWIFIWAICKVPFLQNVVLSMYFAYTLLLLVVIVHKIKSNSFDNAEFSSHCLFCRESHRFFMILIFIPALVWSVINAFFKRKI